MSEACSNCEKWTDQLYECPCDLPQPCPCWKGVCARCEHNIRTNVRSRKHPDAYLRRLNGTDQAS